MGALTVKLFVAVVPVIEAVTVETLLVLTGVVVTVNVALEAPAAMVTEAGTVQEGSLDESVTTVPPAGAGVAV